METIFLESVDSTHRYLKEYINKNGYKKPIAVITHNQTNGIGSRDNEWEGKKGNLFFSFVIKKELLPEDLPLSSASIYFSYLLKEILNNNGSDIWLKWPNDFYLGDKKAGGTITNLKGDLFFCGIGLNLKKVNDEFGYLDIEYNDTILKDYFDTIYKKVAWKRVFSNFLVEFEKSRSFKTTIINQDAPLKKEGISSEKIELTKAVLNNDGSVSIDNKKVFSLR